MPKYSFIMICRNQWAFTEQAIKTLNDSISSDHKENGIELIVINNGSEDKTREGVEQLKVELDQEIEIVPVHLTENMGYLIATNIGLSKSQGEIITLLNNDLIFPNNWFDGIVRTLEKDPSIGAAVPFLSYANGPANVGVRFESFDEIQSFSKEFMKDNEKKILETDTIIGACLSIKKELVSKIGGNDFWFGIGWFEDADWSIRARLTGFKIVIVGASFVYHIGNGTIGKHPELVTSALQANGDKFSKKWKVTNGFNSKELISSIPYSRNKHYFPNKIEDFSDFELLEQQENTSPKKNMILLADWTNKSSKWNEKVLEAKNILEGNEHFHLTLWIPKTYFPEEQLKNELDQILGDTLSKVTYVFEEVSPIDLLKFLSAYEFYLTVEDDFVNLYVNYLIEKAALPINII